MPSVPEPVDPANYCFEHGIARTGGSGARTNGFADVWLRGHFAWEYKAPGRRLDPQVKCEPVLLVDPDKRRCHRDRKGADGLSRPPRLLHAPSGLQACQVAHTSTLWLRPGAGAP